MSDDDFDDGSAGAGDDFSAGSQTAERSPTGPYSAWMAGDFLNGRGLLGMRPPQQDPILQRVVLRKPAPSPAGDLGPIQTASRAVNGVPLAIYQPQPSVTGAAGVGDVDAVIRSLSRLSPSVLERFSNANIPFISVPDSVDQAFPSANLLQKHPRGYPSDQDFGDVAGGYLDMRGDPNVRLRAVVAGSPRLTSSYDVGLHETGHGWDDLNRVNGKAASQQSLFQSAYDAEVPNLLARAEAKAANDPANNDVYYYLLQSPSRGVDAGASEAYAESFARYMSGDQSLKADWPSLYRYWEAQDRAHGLLATPVQNGR